MGAADSKSHQDTAHLQDKKDGLPNACGDSEHTPVTNRRVMKLKDPRSPTEEVQRTPIIVPKPQPEDTDDSFEDPRSPTVRIARTPIPDTDPRSPTVGVSRTPCPFTYPDPRSPTVNVARTPMLKEGESAGKFEMPTVDENDKIVEEAEKDEVQADAEEDVQNVSNNNSGDTARLIDQSPPSDAKPESSGLTPVSEAPAADSTEPNSELEVEATADGVSHEAEEEDCQRKSLIAADKGPSKKSRRPSLTKSIKAKIMRSNSVPPRSPLSTRNLEKDAPVVHVRTEDGMITFDKAGSRRRKASGTPTRLVGKYEPMIDKENC